MTFKPLSYDLDAEKDNHTDAFQDVYIHYMLSKIDYHNQETERYNNDVVMYNPAHMMRMRHGSGERICKAWRHFRILGGCHGKIAIPDYGPKRKQPSDR